MNVTKISDICTGCGMCAAICPSGALQIKSDSHGFLHPTADIAKCTDCGFCFYKCPINTSPQVSERSSIFTGFAKDESLLPKSSSGAIFPILATEIIRRGGKVFGAAFDRDFNVIHTVAQTVADVSALCRSKYVQSNVTVDCYLQIKEMLDDERWVYFSGSPCQVAGLKSYLGRNYKTLITQDTACHSVPSPMVWRDYTKGLEKQYGGKLTAFSFRDKKSGWENYHIHAEFDNDKSFSQLATENIYQRGFIKGLYSRRSCFECQFKGIERCSDITLADYWGVKNIQPKAYNPQGTSLIILHSENGRALLESCKDRLQIIPAEDNAFDFNPAVLRSIEKPSCYDEFWSSYNKKPLHELTLACCEPKKKNLIERLWTAFRNFRTNIICIL